MKILKIMTSSVAFLGLLALAMTGCTTHLGSVVPNSAFIYPNSNITSLGPVKAEKSKTWFFIMPIFHFEDIKAVYNNALNQVPGANVVIDYKEDTAVTSILFFNTITYSVEGTAAKMDIGNKNLK